MHVKMFCIESGGVLCQKTNISQIGAILQYNKMKTFIQIRVHVFLVFTAIRNYCCVCFHGSLLPSHHKLCIS